MSHNDLRESLWVALQAEPKPIDGAQILRIAQAQLPAREYQQFSTWMLLNGPALLEKLNV